MWSVQINNVNEIFQKRFTLFKYYYAYIRNISAQIFTNLIFYVLIPSGTSTTTKYSKIDSGGEITNNKNEKFVSITNQAIHSQDEIKFLTLATRLISNNYCGDYEGLEPFIRSIELLESIVEKNNKEYLRMFILSKLYGRASEVIPANLTTIKEIKDSLRNYILHNQSNLISAKIQALPYEQLSLLQFVKQGEILASAYERALINDSFPLYLANSETVSKILQMCLTKTSSNTVRIILLAASFNNVQDLFCKFLSAETSEKTNININSNYKFNFNHYDDFKRNQNYNNRIKNQNSFYTYNTSVKEPQNRIFYTPNSGMNKRNNTRQQRTIENEKFAFVKREIPTIDPYSNYNVNNKITKNIPVYDKYSSHVGRFDNSYFSPKPSKRDTLGNDRYFRQNFVSPTSLNSKSPNRYSNSKAHNFFLKNIGNVNKHVKNARKNNSFNTTINPERSEDDKFSDNLRDNIKMHEIKNLDNTNDRPDYNTVTIKDLNEK